MSIKGIVAFSVTVGIVAGAVGIMVYDLVSFLLGRYDE